MITVTPGTGVTRPGEKEMGKVVTVPENVSTNVDNPHMIICEYYASK
jgi:hypothetical protein